jgi:hypothetical protein
MTEAGMFFQKTGPAWDTLRAPEQRLEEADIDCLVIGGLALGAHNLHRQTVGVDVILTGADYQKFIELYEGPAYSRAEGAPRRFLDPASGVTIDVLIAGELAGHTGKNRTVRFPDPQEAETHGDLRTVPLARLIELKLVTWRYKDWGDVVELIRANSLIEPFVDRLDPTVRSAFKQCFDQANDPQYEGP